MAADDDVQSWFDEMPDKVQRKMSGPMTEAADKLASAIKEAAPKRSGALAESIQVRQDEDGVFWVTAGGDLTTKFYDRSTGYQREVIIDGRDNSGIAKKSGGSGVSYDYAMSVEFGNRNESAEPFFYNTILRVAPELQDDVEDAISDALND